MNEKYIELKLKKAVENLGGLAFKFVSPGNAGVPDRIILLPNGRVWFVEVKRSKGGRLSPLQIRRIETLEQLGFNVRVVRSIEDINNVISEMEAL